MPDIPRQLIYQDKRGYGEIYNDPSGVNNFLVQICQSLITKCNLNGSCVDLVKIINDSFYYSIKFNQQPEFYAAGMDEMQLSELSSNLGSEEKVLITKILIYLLLSFNHDTSAECKKILNDLGKKLKKEVPKHSDFSAYGFFEWLKSEKKKVSFTVDLSPRPRKVSELEDHEIYDLTDKFSLTKIKFVIDLYESKEDKEDAVTAIEACVERYKDKLGLPERSYTDVCAFLHNSNVEDTTADSHQAFENNELVKEQARIIEELKAELSNKEAMLISKDMTIESLRTHISELETDTELYRSSLNDSEENYKKLTEQTASLNEAYCVLYALAEKHDLFKQELDGSCTDKDKTTDDPDERAISLKRLVDAATHCGDRKLANSFDLLIRKALNEDITREDIRILNTIDAAYCDEEKELKEDAKLTAEAIKGVAGAIRENPPHIMADKLEVMSATIDKNHAPIHIGQQNIIEASSPEAEQRALTSKEIRQLINN